MVSFIYNYVFQVLPRQNKILVRSRELLVLLPSMRFVLFLVAFANCQLFLLYFSGQIFHKMLIKQARKVSLLLVALSFGQTYCSLTEYYSWMLLGSTGKFLFTLLCFSSVKSQFTSFFISVSPWLSSHAIDGNDAHFIDFPQTYSMFKYTDSSSVGQNGAPTIPD